MKKKPFGVLRHACRMVRRNLRSYAMLSVTIILSFSILLGFMGYMDSEHYNVNYKGPFSLDRGLVRINSYALSPAQTAQLQEKAAQYGTTHSLQYLKTGFYLDTMGWALATGERLDSIMSVTVFSIPRECWFIGREFGGDFEPYTVTWLDGRDSANITLESGQILMDEQLFKALGLSRDNNTQVLNLREVSGYSGKYTGTFTVVGTVPSTYPMEIKTYETAEGETKASISDSNWYKPVLIFSLDDINPEVIGEDNWLRTVIFHSDEPESIKQMIESLQPEQLVHTVYDRQDRALEVIRTEKATKAMVAILLLLILGINLYSSFENALNDRKFEIGVKRAVGASAFSIVRQFFYESMLVMMADILISVAVVVDAGLLLKLYRQATHYIVNEAEATIYHNLDYENYVLYITPYSIGMFAVCAVVLTVVFSLIFAYKSTQVQIVDYLKAE